MNIVAICLHCLDIRGFHSYLRDTPFLDGLRSNSFYIHLGRAQAHHSDDSLNAEMTGGLKAKAGVGQYAAIKHALKAFADGLRDEVNEYGVRVISIYPGQTSSPMQARLYQTAQKTYVPERLLQPSDVAEVVLSVLNLPTSAEVTGIAVRPTCSPRPA